MAAWTAGRRHYSHWSLAAGAVGQETAWLFKPDRSELQPNAWPLVLSVLASFAVAGYSMAQDPHDQAGSLPQEIASAAPVYGGEVPDGDWHQYGRTPYGQRYSPLTQVNVDNVSQLKEAWRYQTGT